MYYTCKCCKEICNESKKHDFMEDWHARNKVSHYYPHPKDKTFAGTIDQLMGHVCKECFLAFKEFEFQWEENKIMAEMHQQDEYERWKEEGCQNCDRH